VAREEWETNGQHAVEMPLDSFVQRTWSASSEMIEEPTERVALDSVVGESLRPVMVGLLFLVVSLALRHPLVRPVTIAFPLTAAAVVSVLALCCGLLRLSRGEIPLHLSQPIAVGICGLVLANSFLHLFLVPEPQQTTTLILFVIGVGLFLLSFPWLFFLLGVTWMGWGGIVWAAPASPAWVHFGFALFISTVLACMAHAARMRTYRRLECARLQSEGDKEKLTKALHTVRQSEERYREFFENSVDAIASLSLDGTIFQINQEAELLWGYERDEALGRHFSHFITEESTTLAWERIGCSLNGEEVPPLFELACVCKDGRIVPVECRSRFLRDEEEKPTGIQVSFRDITERRRMEEQLQQQAEELERRVEERTAELKERQRFIEQITNTMPTILYLCDLTTYHISYVNPRVKTALGYDGEKVMEGRTSILEFIHPEDVVLVNDRFQRYGRAQDGEVLVLEYRMRHRDGGWRWLRDQGTVFTRAADGKPLQVLGAAQDITEQKRTAEALQAAEEEYRAIFEHASIGIYRSSLDGKQIRANPALVKLNGYSSEEEMLPAVNDIASEWYVNPQRRDEFARLLEELGRVTDFESEIYRHKTRERIWISETARLVRDRNGKPLYYEGTVQDITVRKRAEEELRRTKEAAEAADRVKSEFLATMSHELRTPLNIIIGYTDLLCEQEFGPLASEQQTVLRRIDQRARELFDLISAVLDLTAMENGRLHLQRREVQVAALLRELENEFRDIQERSPVKWEWQSDAVLPSVFTDPGKLKIILKNLIGNAAKFTSQGHISIHARNRGGEVEVSVADTGIGIPQEALQTVFEPFYQVDSSNSRRYDGTGLGLHIVQRLLSLLGGSVAVESENGHGSTFRVHIPCKPVEVVESFPSAASVNTASEN